MANGREIANIFADIEISDASIAKARAQVQTAFAKPFKVSIIVDEKGNAGVVRSVEKTQKQIVDAESKSLSVRKANQDAFQKKYIREEASFLDRRFNQWSKAADRIDSRQSTAINKQRGREETFRQSEIRREASFFNKRFDQWSKAANKFDSIITKSINSERAKKESFRRSELLNEAHFLNKRFDQWSKAEENITHRTIGSLDRQAELRQKHINSLARQEIISFDRSESNKERHDLSEIASANRHARSLELIQARLDASLSRGTFASRLKTSLDSASNSLRDFDHTATRVLRTSLTAFTVWSAGVTAAVAAVGIAGIAAFAKLETAATRASSIVASDKFNESLLKTGRGITNFAAVADAAQKRIIAQSQRVALDTLFSPTEVTEGTKALVQAGQDVEDALKNIGPVAQFAQISEIGLEEASAGLAAGLAAAGLQAKDSGLLLDKFAFVAQNSLGEAGDFMDAFANRSAAAAKTFGFSNDELLTLLSLLGQTGTLGQEAGTQAAIVFRELSRGAGRAGKAWKAAGIDINGPLNETILKIGELATSVQRTKGRAGVADLAKQLGLTFRSVSSILQVLPQAQDLGLERLNNLTDGIAKSQGNIARQSDRLLKTIGFQFDNLVDTLIIGLAKFGEAASGQVTELFDQFGGFGGLLDKAAPSLERFGAAFGKLIGRLAVFVQTKEFANGVKILVESVQITLRGVSEAFKAFGEAFGGVQEGQSAFVAFAKAIRGFSSLAAATLPIVARIIGQIINFLIEHKDAFEFFAKATITIVVLRKAYALLGAPILTAVDAMLKMRKAMVAASAAESSGLLVSALNALGLKFLFVDKSAKAATASVEAFSAAQVASSGAGLLGKRVSAPASGVAGGAALLPEKNVMVHSRIAAAINAENIANKAFVKSLGKVAFAAAGLFTIFSSSIDGFRKKWKELSEDTNNKDFIDGLMFIGKTFEFLWNVIDFVFIKPFRVAFRNLKKLGLDFGDTMAVVTGEIVSAIGSIDDIFNSTVQEIGNGLAELLIFVSDSIGKLGVIPGLGDDIQKITDRLDAAADAADGWGEKAKKSADDAKSAFSVTIPKYLKDTRKNVWVLNQEWVRNQRVTKIARRQTVAGIRAIADAAINFIPGATKAFDLFNNKLIEVQANAAAASEFTRVFNTLTETAITPESQADVLSRASNAAAVARLRVLNLYPDAITKASDAEEMAHKRRKKRGGGGGTGDGVGDGTGDGTGGALKTVKDAATLAAEAVDKLTASQFRQKASAIIAKVQNANGKAYKATRVEAEILSRTLPMVDAALEKQRESVAKLDEQLQKLQATQLKGTRAFSDQAFSLEQSVKQLQLQRLDLLTGGKTDEDSAVKAIDEQITKLQQQAERLSLVESIQLDPLRRKLEQTFAPVKEISFTEAIDQFKLLSKTRAKASEDLTKQETLRTKLDTVVQQASDKFFGVGKNIALGVAKGAEAGKTAIVKGAQAGADAYLNTMNTAFQFGSPSKVTEQRGKWLVQGMIIGMRSEVGNALATVRSLRNNMVTVLDNGVMLFTNAGEALMIGFFNGMKTVFEKTIKPFIGGPHGVAAWIKANKGPLAYDSTLLVPAGEAMMSGFHRGLQDGFSEIKGWVGKVGPQLANDGFPNDLFIKRSANFLIGNAKADLAFDPNVEFNDLLSGTLGGAFGGILDPSLGFLHKTLSLADTTKMAQHLAKLYGLQVTALKYDHNKFTSSGNISDHFYGTAADLSNGSQPTPQMDAIAAALKPLFGTIFKQLIYRDHDLNTGSIIGGHRNHIHVAWLKAAGFDLSSGKLGKPSSFDIPGASNVVDAAINQASQHYGIDVALLAAIAKQESGFNPNAKSGDGGYGLFQLTSKDLVAKTGGNPFDPFKNADVGAYFFKTLLNRFGGSVSNALAGYNAGPGAVESGRIPSSTLNNYIPHILKYFNDFKKLFGGFRERGGPLDPRKWHVVGEKGPEIIGPGARGMVYSNAQSQQMMSGGSTYQDQRTYNVSTNATDPQAVVNVIQAHSRSMIGPVNLR